MSASLYLRFCQTLFVGAAIPQDSAVLFRGLSMFGSPVVSDSASQEL